MMKLVFVIAPVVSLSMASALTTAPFQPAGFYGPIQTFPDSIRTDPTKASSVASELEAAITSWVASITTQPQYSALITEAPSAYASEYSIFLQELNGPLFAAQKSSYDGRFNSAEGALRTWSAFASVPSSIKEWQTSVDIDLNCGIREIVTRAGGSFTATNDIWACVNGKATSTGTSVGAAATNYASYGGPATSQRAYTPSMNTTSGRTYVTPSAQTPAYTGMANSLRARGASYELGLGLMVSMAGAVGGAALLL